MDPTSAPGPDDGAPDPRGGRREHIKSLNRQAILDAARRVFARLGYDATTVRDIIRDTDLASGTFYNYFKSKEEVYEALQDDSARRFRPILREAIARAGSFENFVYAAVRAYFQFLADESAEQPLQGGPMRVDTPDMRAVFEEVRSHIAAAVKAGEAPAVDADCLAAACIGLVREVGMVMEDRRPIDVDTAARFCATMIRGGIGAFAGEAPAAD